MVVTTILRGKTRQSVVTVNPDLPLRSAAKILHQNRIGALVVVNECQAIVGMLSERDIANGLAVHGMILHGLKVRDLMTQPVLTCTPFDSLDNLMTVMTSERVRHLPVVEDGKLTGMVTIGDLVKAQVEEMVFQRDSLRDYIIDRY